MHFSLLSQTQFSTGSFFIYPLISQLPNFLNQFPFLFEDRKIRNNCTVTLTTRCSTIFILFPWLLVIPKTNLCHCKIYLTKILMVKFIVQWDKKDKSKYKNMKTFAVLQISFLAQVQKACWHILPQHTAYWHTVGKGEKEKKINEVWWERNVNREM